MVSSFFFRFKILIRLFLIVYIGQTLQMFKNCACSYSFVQKKKMLKNMEILIIILILKVKMESKRNWIPTTWGILQKRSRIYVNFLDLIKNGHELGLKTIQFWWKWHFIYIQIIMFAFFSQTFSNLARCKVSLSKYQYNF